MNENLTFPELSFPQFDAFQITMCWDNYCNNFLELLNVTILCILRPLSSTLTDK